MAKPTLYSDNSKPQNFLEVLQSAIINRLSKPYGGNEPIIYEFTHDRALLHQYYRLRELMYRKVHHLDQFSAQEDVYDKLSHVLIARRGRLCLGGCRLTIREPDEMWPLPAETETFSFRGAFPQLALEKESHAEISRFAVMEDSGDENIFYGLCKVMFDKVIDSKIRYLFAKSPYTLARNWRLVAHKLGVKNTRICDEIDVPEDPHLPEFEWHIIYSDLLPYWRSDDRTVATSERADDETFAEAEKPHLSLAE
jgi:hypothetical protein